MKKSVRMPKRPATGNRKGVNGVGRFSVAFTATNERDVVLAEEGSLPRNQVRQVTLSGVVDPGAVTLVLPRSAVLQLGLPIAGKSLVKYANGSIAERDTVEGVAVTLLGRRGVFSAIVEPKRRDALIGAIVLEQLDFLVDPKLQRLFPRDPRGPIYEL